MSRVLISGFAAVAGPIEGLDDVSISNDMIHSFAKSMREGKIPMGIEHDEQNYLNPFYNLVDVRPTPTGSLGLWVEVSLDEKDWERVESKKAFSISFTTSFFESNMNDGKPLIEVTASDKRQFNDEVFESVLDDLEPYFAIKARRLHQLSDLPAAQVIIEVSVNALGGIIAYGAIKAIEFSLKKFLTSKGGQETKFTFKKGDMEFSLQTRDADALRDAIQRLLPEPQLQKQKVLLKNTNRSKSH